MHPRGIDVFWLQQFITWSWVNDFLLAPADLKYHLATDGLTDGLTWVGARDTCVSKKMKYPPFKAGQTGGRGFSKLLISLDLAGERRSPPSKPIKIFKRGKFIKKPNEGRLFKLRKYQVRLTLMEAYFDQKLEVQRQKIWDCAASLSNIERADISKPERFFERDFSW